MRKSAVVFPVAYLIALSTLGYAAVRGVVVDTARKPGSVPTFVLKGYVWDEKGKPVAGSTVTLDYWEGYDAGGKLVCRLADMPELLSAVSGEDGLYTIPHLPDPAGFRNLKFKLSASKDGRADVHMHLENSDVKAANFAQPLECMLQGSFTLPDGSPAPPNTRLEIRVEPRWGSESRQAYVDGDGRFAQGKLPPGKATLMLSNDPPINAPIRSVLAGEPELPKWVLPAAAIDLKPGEPNSVELKATEGAVVRGALLDPDTGRPWPNATLRINHAGRPDGQGKPDVCQTDKNGHFAARVPEGEVKIRIDEVVLPDATKGEVSGNRLLADCLVREGENKTDLKVELSGLDVRRTKPDAAAMKPISPSFALKAGTYQLAWDPTFYCGPDVKATSAFEKDDEAKALMKKLPRLSDRARYMAFRVDGPGNEGLIGAIVDVCGTEQKAEQTILSGEPPPSIDLNGLAVEGRWPAAANRRDYDTIYLDRNRNWDLTDDEPITFRMDDSNWYGQRTKWVEVAAHQGAGRSRTSHPVMARPVLRRQAITMWFSGDFGGEGGGESYTLDMWLERKGAWKGTLETNRGRVQCVALDRDFNGAYDDLMAWKKDLTPRSDGDAVLIDTNGYGKAFLAVDAHAMPLNACVKVGRELYTLKPSTRGDRLTVARYAGSTGKLNVRAGTVKGLRAEVGEMILTGRQGFFRILAHEPMPLRLPAGEYKLWTCDVIVRSPKGRDLPLRCAAETRVCIRPNKEWPLRIGGELGITILPAGKMLSWKGGTQGLDLEVELGNDLLVTSIGANSNGYLPTVKFFDAKGNLAQAAKTSFT